MGMRLLTSIGLLGAFLGLLLLRADAQTAARRVALVIGNGTYEEAGTLANPVNDALDIAAGLRAIGFEVVEAHDLGKRALERKIGEFSDALAGADVGLFFYAGHGIQVDGRNFILPVDAKVDVPAKLRLEAVQIDDILDIMEEQTTTSLVFLDACRNNPFVRKIGQKASDRGARALAGLAQFDTTRGSFIAFSTAPGSVALDGAGRNSPFVKALLAHMPQPGQSINDLMIAVRRDVVAATKGAQRPWEQGSLIERFEFVPDGETAAGALAVAPETKPAAQQEVAALERSVVDPAASVESFLRDEYLAPDVDDMQATVRRLYMDGANIYGTALNIKTIVETKQDWFAQFQRWTFKILPDSLEVTPGGDDFADAEFSMSYDYVRKGSGARLRGKVKVSLGLVKSDGLWRIATETSQLLD